MAFFSHLLKLCQHFLTIYYKFEHFLEKINKHFRDNLFQHKMTGFELPLYLPNFCKMQENLRIRFFHIKVTFHFNPTEHCPNASIVSAPLLAAAVINHGDNNL